MTNNNLNTIIGNVGPGKTSSVESILEEAMTSEPQRTFGIEDPVEYPCHGPKDTVLLFSHRSSAIIGHTTMDEIKKVQRSKSRLALSFCNVLISFTLWMAGNLISAAVQLPSFLTGLALIAFLFAPNETIAFFQGAAGAPMAQFSAGLVPVIGITLVITTGLQIFTGNTPNLIGDRFSASATLQRKLKLPAKPVLAIRELDLEKNGQIDFCDRFAI